MRGICFHELPAVKEMEGASALICAIVMTAIEDYRSLERKRIVKSGKTIDGGAAAYRRAWCHHHLKRKRVSKDEQEAREIISFLRNDVKQLARAWNLKLSTRYILKQLGIQ